MGDWGTRPWGRRPTRGKKKYGAHQMMDPVPLEREAEKKYGAPAPPACGSIGRWTISVPLRCRRANDLATINTAKN